MSKIKLLIPRIQPDEFIASWVFRVACFNSIYNLINLKTHLRALVNVGNRYEATGMLHIASKVLNQKTAEFCAEHSTFGDLYNGLGIKRKLIEGRQAAVYQLGINNGTAKACKKCAMEDLRYHGYVYFRRTHQFEGVRICTKHMTKLFSLTLSTRSSFIKYKNIIEEIEEAAEETINDVSDAELAYYDMVEETARELDDFSVLNEIIENPINKPMTLSKNEKEWIENSELKSITQLSHIIKNSHSYAVRLNWIPYILGYALKHKDSLAAYKQYSSSRIDKRGHSLETPLKSSNDLTVLI